MLTGRAHALLRHLLISLRGIDRPTVALLVLALPVIQQREGPRREFVAVVFRHFFSFVILVSF